MVELATLGIAIDSKPVAEASRDLERLSEAARKAERSADSFGKGASDAAKRVANDNQQAAATAEKLSASYARLAAVISGALVSAFAALSLNRFIENTVEADAAQAQLAAVLKSTAGVAGQTAESLNAHAEALQNVTSFGDDAVTSAQALLLTFTRIRGESFEPATAAVTNLATAMKMDLRSAAMIVGKAMNDPVLGMTAMQRAGIQFTEAQKLAVKAMIASNNILGAHRIILKELEVQFGGSAKAARETLGGALTSVKNAWGDLFELGKTATDPLRLALEALIVAFKNPAFKDFIQTVGGALVAAAAAAVQGATYLVERINNLGTYIAAIGPYAVIAAAGLALIVAPAILSGLAVAAGWVVALGAAAVVAAAQFTVGWLAALGPLRGVILVLTAAAAAAYAFRDDIKQALGIDVVEVAKTAANFIMNSFEAAFEDLAFLVNNFKDIFKAAMAGAVNFFIDGINAMLGYAVTGMNKMITVINSIRSLVGQDALPLISPGDVIDRLDNEAAARLRRSNEEQTVTIRAIMARDRFAGSGGAASGAAGDVFGPPVAPPAKPANVNGDNGASAASYAKLVASAHQFIAAQNLERESLDMTGTAAKAFKYEQDLLAKAASSNITLTKAQSEEIRALAKAMAEAEIANNLAAMYKKITEKGEEFIASQNLERESLFMSETAAKTLRYEMDLLNMAKHANITVTAEQAVQIKNLARGMAEAEVSTVRLREIVDLMKGAFSGFFSDLSQGLRTSGNLWTSLADAAVKALNRIADGLLKMASDAMFGQLFGSLFGNLLGGVFGGGAGGIKEVGKFHGGGAVGSDRPSGASYIHPAYFDNAPRFHNGRLPWNPASEMPAILTKDETVLTPGQMRQLAPAKRGGGVVNQFAFDIKVDGSSGDPAQDERYARALSDALDIRMTQWVAKNSRVGGAFNPVFG